MASITQVSKCELLLVETEIGLARDIPLAVARVAIGCEQGLDIGEVVDLLAFLCERQRRQYD
jgi:hypothetical protein